MEKLGEVLGWAAAVCYFIAVANLFVKQIFRLWIAKLPKDNALRKVYQIFMRLVVKYHRYFGIAAGVFALFHLCWQIIHVRVSYSGVASAVLMALTAILGILIAYCHKGSLTKVHRPAALTILAVILFHMITKI